MKKLAIQGTSLEKEVGEGFNWAALAFGFFWYLYKGMWLRGLLYAVVALIVPGFSWIVVWLYAGFRANQEYYEHLVKKGYRDSTSPPQSSVSSPQLQETPLVESKPTPTSNPKKSGIGDKAKMIALATFIVFLVIGGIAIFAPSQSDKPTEQENDTKNTQASVEGDVKAESEEKEDLAKNRKTKRNGLNLRPKHTVMNIKIQTSKKAI